MKDSFDKFKSRLPKKTLSSCFVVLVGITFYFIVQNLDYIADRAIWILSLLTPFILGFVFAYLLYPFVNFFENKLLIKMLPTKNRLRRNLAVFCSILMVLLLLLSLMLLVLPQTIDNLTTLINQLPTYAHTVMDFINQKLTQFHIDPELVKQFNMSTEQMVQTVSKFVVDSVPTLVGFSSKLSSGISNTGIAMVAAIYMLLAREKFKRQVKKVLYALVKRERADQVIEITRLTDKTFSGFITAQLLDALLIGSLCFIGLTIIQMPYAPLISTLVGAFNIIPFFGPIIGAALSILIILIAEPSKIIWLLVFLFLLQQIDGNLINPRLIGERVGLPPIWVMLAIIVGGGIFGFVGMLVGVPTFAAIYVLFQRFIHRRLDEREVPEELLTKEETPPSSQKIPFSWLPVWLKKKAGKGKKS